ncbi:MULTISPECIES: hypothetical protein [Streptomyces]|uniref:hypothetical protein n=1 Tax=Streptomyces TaxID=1883 RepID=UPI001E4B02A3|nr:MULTISPECIES: hypothetical protein [Streptomyces]
MLASGEADSGDHVHYRGLNFSALARLAEWCRPTETGDTQETAIDGHPRIISTLAAV